MSGFRRTGSSSGSGRYSTRGDEPARSPIKRGEPPKGYLLGISQVQRTGEARFMVHQRGDSSHHVVDVAEGPALGSVTVNGKRLSRSTPTMKLLTTRPSPGCMGGRMLLKYPGDPDIDGVSGDGTQRRGTRRTACLHRSMPAGRWDLPVPSRFLLRVRIRIAVNLAVDACSILAFTRLASPRRFMVP